jgi:hypothetical protein
MALPRRIPKEPKRATRWRSPAHTTWIRGFACCVCGSMTNIAAAHVRLGSHTGMSQKPDDWRTVPMCDGPFSSADGLMGCHNRQHIDGEATFWRGNKIDVEALLIEFAKASPKSREIAAIRKEREAA